MNKTKKYLITTFALLLDALQEQGYILSNGKFNLEKAKQDTEHFAFWIKIKNIYTFLLQEVRNLKGKERDKISKEIDAALKKLMPEDQLSESYIMLITALSIGDSFNSSLCPKHILLKAELNKFANLQEEAIEALRDIAGRETVRASLVIANSIKDFIEDGKLIPVELKLQNKPRWAKGA